MTDSQSMPAVTAAAWASTLSEQSEDLQTAISHLEDSEGAFLMSEVIASRLSDAAETLSSILDTLETIEEWSPALTPAIEALREAGLDHSVEETSFGLAVVIKAPVPESWPRLYITYNGDTAPGYRVITRDGDNRGDGGGLLADDAAASELPRIVAVWERMGAYGHYPTGRLA